MPRSKPIPCADCGVMTDRMKRCAPCSERRGTEQRAAWHKAHPERTREANRRFRERHPERVTKRWLEYKVDDATFRQRLEDQGGFCDICRTREPGAGGWNWDHDHCMDPKDPDSHRGVLCRACNLMLGNAKDDIETLQRVAAYLKRHKLGIRVIRCA